MKIGFTTYPTAFQLPGGLEVQIRETMQALNALGVDARIVQLYQEEIRNFDIIHHFSLNHASWRILEFAKKCGIKTVCSPVVTADSDPSTVWRKHLYRKIIHRLLGSEFAGRWDNTVFGLQCSDVLCALTPNDKQVIERLEPRVADRIHVLPNGVGDDFFLADETEFKIANPNEQDFILIASSIRRYKNQLGVINAAKSLGYRVLLAGPVSDADYYRRCMDAGGESVRYLGQYQYPSQALMSVFAAAKLVVLASYREPFGLTPFEALAAGTAAILTTVSQAPNPSAPPYFIRVAPDNEVALREAIQTAMSAPRDREGVPGTGRRDAMEERCRAPEGDIRRVAINVTEFGEK